MRLDSRMGEVDQWAQRACETADRTDVSPSNRVTPILSFQLEVESFDRLASCAGSPPNLTGLARLRRWNHDAFPAKAPFLSFQG